MLTDSGMSDEAINKYCAEIGAFAALGSELDENIIRDMGEKFVMSEAERDMPLANRMEDAVSRAKAQIEKYPDIH